MKTTINPSTALLVKIFVAALSLTFLLVGFGNINAQNATQNNFTDRVEGVVLEDSNAIDLGLSVLWADRNVGAETPTDYGQYFAWGEIAPKRTYTWKNYKFCKNGNYYKLTKYCDDPFYGIVDNKDELDPEDDAAVQNFGEGWRMPTESEFSELIKNCDYKDGVFTSRINGNKISFPMAGWICDDGKPLLKGSIGYYWSSTGYPVNLEYALSCNFDDLRVGSYGRTQRYYGLSIRAVRDKE